MRKDLVKEIINEGNHFIEFDIPVSRLEYYFKSTIKDDTGVDVSEALTIGYDKYSEEDYNDIIITKIDKSKLTGEEIEKLVGKKYTISEGDEQQLSVTDDVGQAYDNTVILTCSLFGAVWEDNISIYTNSMLRAYDKDYPVCIHMLRRIFDNINKRIEI